MNEPKVHLVGSIPLFNTSSVFSTIPKALPNLLKRIPDGETGTRSYFGRWQIAVFSECKWILNERLKSSPLLQEYEPLSDKRIDAFNRDVDVDLAGKERKIRILPTRYDDFAIESYKEFAKARERGDLAEGVRFQVSLPTPLNIIASCIDPEYQVQVERLYEKKLLESLRRIQDSIPAKDLAIQWDCPIEFIMLEQYGQQFTPWWCEAEDIHGVKEGILSRWAELCAIVDEGVEMGFHLCYGDLGHKHFVEPRDMGVMVDMFLALKDRVKRRVDWVHMPVPKERKDEQYFEALERLNGKMEGTELYLGLVHAGDEEGTRERIRVAKGVFKGSFGVATECGLGRTEEGELESIWGISRNVCSSSM